MKTYIFIIIFCMSSVIGAHAQTYIKPKNDRAIRNIRIHEITEYKVVYEQDGSLHDIYIPLIDHVVENGSKIYFDENNAPIYPEWNRRFPEGEDKYGPASPDSSKHSGQSYRKPPSTTDQVIAKDRYFFLRPLGMLEYYGKLYGGVNWQVGEIGYLKAGAGIIFHNYDDDLYGFETGLEYKMVLKAVERPKTWRENYFAVGTDYKYVEKWHRPQQLIKLNVKMGYQRFHDNGMFTDLYFGLGVRKAWGRRDFIFTDRPHLLLGIDIGF